MFESCHCDQALVQYAHMSNLADVIVKSFHDDSNAIVSCKDLVSMKVFMRKVKKHGFGCLMFLLKYKDSIPDEYVLLIYGISTKDVLSMLDKDFIEFDLSKLNHVKEMFQIAYPSISTFPVDMSERYVKIV